MVGNFASKGETLANKTVEAKKTLKVENTFHEIK